MSNAWNSVKESLGYNLDDINEDQIKKDLKDLKIKPRASKKNKDEL